MFDSLFAPEWASDPLWWQRHDPVLVALSVWSALWGLPGAILAIPMTSMLVIICAAFGPTRFVAVLLAGQPAAEGQEARPA